MVLTASTEDYNRHTQPLKLNFVGLIDLKNKEGYFTSMKITSRAESSAKVQ